MKYPDVDKEMYLELFKTLSEVQLTPDLGLGMLKDMKERQTGFKTFRSIL